MELVANVNKISELLDYLFAGEWTMMYQVDLYLLRSV